jgi:hypothetical protein
MRFGENWIFKSVKEFDKILANNDENDSYAT